MIPVIFCAFFLEEVVNTIVEGGAVPLLVKHLQAPPSLMVDDDVMPFEHEVEKASAFALGLLAVKVGADFYLFIAILIHNLLDYSATVLCLAWNLTKKLMHELNSLETWL